MTLDEIFKDVRFLRSKVLDVYIICGTEFGIYIDRPYAHPYYFDYTVHKSCYRNRHYEEISDIILAHGGIDIEKTLDDISNYFGSSYKICEF